MGDQDTKWKIVKNSQINLLFAHFSLKYPSRWQSNFPHFPALLQLISPHADLPLTILGLYFS